MHLRVSWVHVRLQVDLRLLRVTASWALISLDNLHFSLGQHKMGVNLFQEQLQIDVPPKYLLFLSALVFFRHFAKQSLKYFCPLKCNAYEKNAFLNNWTYLL